MKTLFQPKKLNVANLGNIVSQLHIHIIARFNTDLAWPQPIWNSGIAKTYTDQEKQDRIALLANAFKEKS
jgi:diadenosine tetraphosphate (Ap4A) HIT family hydrolase